MVEIDIEFTGNLSTKLTHGPSGTILTTDAPKDNQGEGKSFSPTDLTASSLIACMLTIMAIYAKRHGWDLTGVKGKVIKEMTSEPPRKIAKLSVYFQMPKRFSEAERKALEAAALTCPVHKSLHPEVEIPVRFDYI
ncbi:MAG TPA: OsmC family protein [Candidatus Omnitrophota bacterium]|nr:OsmC family protein [Candidatus Omnitrophota bacterium]